MKKCCFESMKPKSFNITNSNNNKSSMTSQHRKTTTATTMDSRNRRRASARSTRQNHDIWMQAFRYSCRWSCTMCDWLWRWWNDGVVLFPWLNSKWFTRFEDDVLEAVGSLELSCLAITKSVVLCYVTLIQRMMYGHEINVENL